MFEDHIKTAKRLADRAKAFDFIEAIAISGSIQSGAGTRQSDVDTYLYITRDITRDERNQLMAIGTKNRQIIDYWGASDYYTDAETLIDVDCMYFRTEFMQDQLNRVLVHHQAQMGYTTAFWHTIQQSLILVDQSGWFEQLQTQSKQAYPDGLVDAIVTLNLPILGDIETSYRAQLAKAIDRQDLLSINHRLTAFFASYFDILFAINKTPHVGEKRMLTFATHLEKQPVHMQGDIMLALQHSSANTELLLGNIDHLIENLKRLLKAENLI